MSNTITPYREQAQTILERADAIAIKDQETMAEAVSILGNMKTLLERATDEKEKITKPLNQALTEERKRWKPIIDPLEAHINDLRAKISKYQTEAKRIADKEAEKIAAKLSKGTLKLSTAMTKLESIDQPETTYHTDENRVSFRTSYSVEITDQDLIPRDYLIPNERLILDDLKHGKNIPGTKLIETQTPIHQRY